MSTIKVKKDEATGDLYFDIADFNDIIDTSLVEYYEMEAFDDKSVAVTFYDKDKNQIKPNKA